jgi:hypothetical protein
MPAVPSLLAQAADATPAPTSASTPAPTFHVDLSGLASLMWSELTSHLGDIGTAAWTDLTQWGYSLLRSMFLGIWNATLIPIPHDVTDQFGPVKTVLDSSLVIAAAGVVLAVVLLGVRTLVRGITGRGGVLDELVGRIMVYACCLSLLPWPAALARRGGGHRQPVGGAAGAHQR